jgi:hypothetical protein
LAFYRLFLRNSGVIVGRDEFDAVDDATAYAVGESLYFSVSDCCNSFEVWQGARPIQPPTSTPTQINETAQAIVAEREEAIRESNWPIASSRKLLQRLGKDHLAKAE